jgi:hypothetical protein
MPHVTKGPFCDDSFLQIFAFLDLGEERTLFLFQFYWVGLKRASTWILIFGFFDGWVIE